MGVIAADGFAVDPRVPQHEPVIPRPDRAAARAVSAVTSTATSMAGEAVDAVARGRALLGTAEELTARARALVERIEAVTARAEAAVADVERATAGAEDQVRRVSVIVDQSEPLVAVAVPKARRFLDDLTDHELAAMIRLIDRTPEILEHVDETVVPTMARMSEVGPDIKQLLTTVAGLRELLESFPGMGMVRRRAERDDRN